MAIKLSNGQYKCLFCNFTAPRAIEVDSHRDSAHDFVLVPMTKEEISKLIMFFYTKNEELIDQNLYKRLKEYNNSSRKFAKTEEKE